MYDGTIGIHYNFLNRDKFYFNGLLGVGYTRIESGVTSSDLNFISIPIGIETGYALSKNLDLFAGVSYKWLFDRTGSNGYFGGGTSSASGSNKAPDRYLDKVLCENGLWFDGTASGICSDKGGVVNTERDKTLCNDGTWRDTNNSGTCTASGGILAIEQKSGSLINMRAKYGNSVSLGDADALGFKVGLRFNF